MPADAELMHGLQVFIAVRGVAHSVPARQVLAGYEPTASDNRRIVLQVWLTGHPVIQPPRWRF